MRLPHGRLEFDLELTQLYNQIMSHAIGINFLHRLDPGNLCVTILLSTRFFYIVDNGHPHVIYITSMKLLSRYVLLYHVAVLKLH